MDDAGPIWAAKSDDELLEAANELFNYTEAGERVIRAELRRRGLPLPDPPIGTCSRCGRSIPSNHPGDRCSECDEPFPPETLRKLGAQTPEPALVSVLSTQDPGLVPLAKSMLDEEGIEHLVRGEDLQDPFGANLGGSGYGRGPVEFWVREEDADRARTLLDGLTTPPGSLTQLSESRVTIHMAASLDGFIARPDGRVDWLETADEFPDGVTVAPEVVATFLETIGCYVMGSRTYETALKFEAAGSGWVYGDKPVVVLTNRALRRARPTVEFYSGDLTELVNGRLRPRFRSIWVVGGGTVAGDCLRVGLADEIVYSVLPIVIGDGIRFFEKLGKDVLLHLAEVKAYTNGMVELRYEVRRSPSAERRDPTV